MGRNRRHQLDDDRGRNIRHDVEGENRHAAKRAAGQAIHPAKYARSVLCREFCQFNGIDAGNGDVGAEAINDQRAQREPDAVLQLFGFGNGPEIQFAASCSAADAMSYP